MGTTEPARVAWNPAALAVTGLGRRREASDTGIVVFWISAFEYTEQGRRDDTRFAADV